jgi:hypothetical protein
MVYSLKYYPAYSVLTLKEFLSTQIIFIGVLSLILNFIVPPTLMSDTLFNKASAQNATTGNVTSASTQQNDTLTQPGETDIGMLQNLVSTLKQPTSALDVKMAQLSTSNNPADIATLAYIWGFPLVTMERQFNYVTNPNVPPDVGRGPANMKSDNSCATNLMNASFTDIVNINVNTLYCFIQFDLTKEPVVIVVPPVEDRYYTFMFVDAYTNDFAYAGTRATGTSGGTFLLAGPDWKGQVPEGMTKIWSPTNLAWLATRTLVKGQADVANAVAVEDKYEVKPLSVFQGKPATQPTTTQANTSQAVPIGPQPDLIAPTGIEIFDEIGQAMIGNPLNPPDPTLVDKLTSIGIGPGMTPSTQANDTIKAALQTGITEGQKMIDTKVANIGTIVNGWLINAGTGIYGSDYLNRAAVAQFGLGVNVPQEAFMPVTFTDSQGQPLSGANNYTIHFDSGQTPPVDAFWSVTMYNNKTLLVDNPLNRYSIGTYTGLKNNTDGSLDLYLQNQSRGPDKESNWLPAPADSFSLTMRLYLPQPQILNGTWQPPGVDLATG